MTENSREKILIAATKIAQAHGYNGLNFRDLAADVGIKAASIYYYFPGKADLGAAIAKRYWENAAAVLETLLAASSDPAKALRRYPDTFRWALENQNRMCLSGFMAAEYDDLPEAVKKEVQTFSDVNVAWRSRFSQLRSGQPKKMSRGHGLSSLRSAAHSSWRGAAPISSSMTR